jgi:hypothetical protein
MSLNSQEFNGLPESHMSFSHHKSRRPLGFLVAVACVFACGCNGEAIERATVSGKVTLDGKPMSSGQIRFRPTTETGGPAWSTWIKDGQYTTAGTRGTPVGELRIEIDAYRTPAWYKGPPPAADGEEAMIPQEQFLPAKYNAQSDLKMTIPPGSGTIEKDWVLTSH